MVGALKLKDVNLTTVEKYPPFEGSNIITGIGFKHVMYLVEEAVIQHLRERGLAPRFLFEEYGLCLEVTFSSVRLLNLLYLDDLMRIEVRPISQPPDREMSFSILMFVNRNAKNVKASTGKLNILFRKHDSSVLASDLPSELAHYITAEISRLPSLTDARSVKVEGQGFGDSDEVIRRLVPEGANAFVSRRRIPYFYCHYSERIQHSGYLRLLEEVVDLFLADRGLSIRTMLDRKSWVPVVADACVEILREALMEEIIYTVYSVESTFKNLTYAARMDCYVVRNEDLIHTATGRITHGYIEIRDRHDIALVNFDEATIKALSGKGLAG